jgi:hypothetical protein
MLALRSFSRRNRQTRLLDSTSFLPCEPFVATRRVRARTYTAGWLLIFAALTCFVIVLCSFAPKPAGVGCGCTQPEAGNPIPTRYFRRWPEFWCTNVNIWCKSLPQRIRSPGMGPAGTAHDTFGPPPSGNSSNTLCISALHAFAGRFAQATSRAGRQY